MLKAAKPAESNEIALRAAKNLRGVLAEERWSGRKAAMALGLTPMYVSRRLSGEAELSVSDVDMFARLLKIGSSELYAILIRPTTIEDGDLMAAAVKRRPLDYGGKVSQFRPKGSPNRRSSRIDPSGPRGRAA